MEIELLGIFARVVSQFLFIGRVDKAIVAAERRVGGEYHLLGLLLGDGKLGQIEGLVEAVAAEADILEEFESVEGVALEGDAVVASGEAELLVELEQTAQEAHLDAYLTLNPRRVRQTHLKYAANAGVDEYDFSVDEMANLDVQTQLGSQIGVELT